MRGRCGQDFFFHVPGACCLAQFPHAGGNALLAAWNVAYWGGDPIAFQEVGRALLCDSLGSAPLGSVLPLDGKLSSTLRYESASGGYITGFDLSNSPSWSIAIVWHYINAGPSWGSSHGCVPTQRERKSGIGCFLLSLWMCRTHIEMLSQPHSFGAGFLKR